MELRSAELSLVELRVAQPIDGAGCAAIYRPIVEETWISFETAPPTVEEMSGRIEALLPQFPWLVASEGDRVLGYVYASPHRAREAYRWSVDVTAYLAEDARGKGLGKRLYRALFEILRRQGYRSAFAGIALPNPASVGLHEAMGFRPVGVYEQVGHKFGGWRDVAWSRLALTQGDEPAREPTPFAVFRRGGDLAPCLEA